nr:MAG TPA: tail tape measure protein [Caudoviricetes sp.]
MSGINFKFTGTNDDVLKKIHQIQNELSKVYNKTNNTKIDLGKDIDFSLLGENFKRLDQQSRDAFNKMSKESQQYTKDIQSNILALQQVEKMQSGLNTLYEEGNMDLDSYIQSQARLTVLHDELAKAIQENEANLRAESVAGKIAEDSIAGLHAKVLLLTTDYMNLSRAQRESLEGAALLKNLQETQTQLDNASLSMNKYAAGAKTRFDALGFSVTQIARELPALAFGPQMFFLAISNNIGPFQDALSSARKEYQMLMEAGKSAIPVWKQLLKSVFSLQTGLSVATTLLVVYGDKITEWISTLFRASAAVDKTATNVRNLSRVMDEAAKQSAAERVELDILYKATQDQTRSLKERNEAADELQRKYPEFFRNLTNEAILAGDAANAYQNLTENILKVAKARAAMKIVEENYGKMYQLQKAINADTNWTNRNKESTKEGKASTTTVVGGSITGYVQTGETLTAEAKEYNRRTKALKDNKKAVDDLVKANEALIKSIDVGAFANSNGSNDINDYIALLNRIEELRKKNASERIRLDTDLENQVEQARINAMEDGMDKEMAQRELNNKIELQDIERQKREYIRKITEAQRQIFEAEEDAKVAKDENYKKKTFDPSSVSVDTSMFDSMSEYTKQKQANETANYYNNILAKYQDYTTKRLSVEKKYQNDLANLEKAGGTEAQKAELLYQREEALNAIDKEFAMREVSFQTWANSITNMSLDELERLLTEAEQELARMENEGGTNGNELAVQRAKVTATKDRIANIKSKESTSPDKRSIKEWQELYKTLSKVEREFEELGDTIGGTVGEIISAAGSISSSTLQMIDGIVTLANSSSTAMSGTAEAASTAIQNVEKASVILSIVGAALQVATKIAGLFKQESSYEKYEEAKEVYESYIDILDQIIEKQLELADSLAGENAQAAYDKAIELYKKQADSARIFGAQYYKSRESGEKSKGYQDFYDMSAAGWQQAASALGISAQELAMMMSKNMTNLFNLPVEQLEKLMLEAPLFIAQLDSEAQEYIKQIIEAENNIKSTTEREMENATGISFESFSDDILESLYDVEKGAEDIADDIADYMRKALIKAMYVKQYEPEMRKWYEMWAEATKDGEIDPEEQTALDNLKNSIIQGAEAGAAAINAQFGTGSTTEQKSTAGGFETMSQDTATELNGRFTALQIAGEESKEQLVLLNMVTNSLLQINQAGFNNTLIQMVQINSYLEDIYTLQRKMFGQLSEKLSSIDRNTKNL